MDAKPQILPTQQSPTLSCVGMSAAAFLPPVVAAWEQAGSNLATGGAVDPEAFLVAVEKLAPIADSLGRVFNFLGNEMAENVEEVRDEREKRKRGEEEARQRKCVHKLLRT